jgi:single-strand DNA-binding protein
MQGVNKVIVLGNVGRDPEVRYSAAGTAVSNLSVACSEKYKDKNGEMKEITEWINVVAFGKLAEIVAEYVKSGSVVFVEGKMKTEKYQDKQTGIDKYSTKVIAERLQFMSRGDSAERVEQPKTQAKGGTFDRFEDDIPFN